jgi:DNA-binding transcriptional ArsR family regulator
MVNNYPGLNKVFQALSDPSRRRMLDSLLAGRELPMRELAKPLRMSWPAATKHARVLAEAGLIVRKRRGREIFCRPARFGLREAETWIARHRKFWLQSFSRLDRHLQSKKHEH